MIRLGLFAKVLGVGVKFLGLSGKVLSDLVKIFDVFIKILRKTKEAVLKVWAVSFLLFKRF